MSQIREISSIFFHSAGRTLWWYGRPVSKQAGDTSTHGRWSTHGTQTKLKQTVTHHKAVDQVQDCYNPSFHFAWAYKVTYMYTLRTWKRLFALSVTQTGVAIWLDLLSQPFPEAQVENHFLLHPWRAAKGIKYISKAENYSPGRLYFFHVKEVHL